MKRLREAWDLKLLRSHVRCTDEEPDQGDLLRELNLIRPGRIEWVEKPDPVLVEATDALVRPFAASRCRRGDALPLNLRGLKRTRRCARR